MRTYQLLHCDTIKTASIVFIYTHGLNEIYNPHYYILVAEVGLKPETNQLLPMNYFPLSKLHLKLQAHLIYFMIGRIEELRGIIKGLWDKHLQGFYTHPGNGKKIPAKNYR